MERSGNTHSKNGSLHEIFEYVKTKQTQGFWGEVLVKFRDGVPYLIKEISQIKLGTKDRN